MLGESSCLLYFPWALLIFLDADHIFLSLSFLMSDMGLEMPPDFTEFLYRKLISKL
jgi:hypothetical protein